MKYCKIALGLLVVILCFLTINCMSKKELIQKSMLPVAVAAFKYDWIVIENTRFRSDEEFKAFVEEQVKDTGYVDISYDTVVRLHETYLIRAWVFYKKVKIKR